MTLEYIEPAQLAALLSSQSDRSSVLVIDVRSSDFVGGNIPGALNLTTDEFSSRSKIDRIVSRHIEPLVSRSSSSSSSPPLVVVHCMRSQTRGPYVARVLSSHLADAGTGTGIGRGQVEVKVLRGGFQGWYRKYYGDVETRKRLFENLERGGDGGEGDWEDVVEADEGHRYEAADSKDLRERLARGRAE